MENEVAMITKEAFDNAVKEEMMSILMDPDFADHPAGAMMLVTGGVTFANAVWRRLMGEKE